MAKVVKLNADNADDFEEMDYMETKKWKEEKLKEIDEQSLIEQKKAEDIKLDGLDGNKILDNLSGAVKLALEAINGTKKLDVRLQVVEKDLEERKNLCDDKEIQALNNIIGSSVQSVLCRYKLVGKQGEANYRTAVYNIVRGGLKKTYHIRFWAKNNTVIPKTLYKDISLSIPQIANGISLEDIKNRARNYKEAQDEKKDKQENETIQNAIQEGRAEELTDGRVVIRLKNK